MATYSHVQPAPSGIPWYDLEIVALVDATNFYMDFLLSDGDNLRIFSSNGDFTYNNDGPTGGTVTNVSRGIANIVNYETIFNIQIPLVVLYNAPTKADFFNLMMGGADTLNGGAGTDYLLGGPGGDMLNGGGGFDFADYASATSGVTANLADPSANTGHAAGDTYNSIEGMWGSAFGDTLVGDGNVNELHGGEGNDHLDGGTGADPISGFGDRMFGGTGDDTYVVDFWGDAAIEFAGEGIDTVLAAANYSLSFSSELENITFIGVGNFQSFGNSLDNVMIGGDGNDRLFGQVGADTLVGGAGDDVLEGNADPDSLFGGEGNDTIWAGGEDLIDGGAGFDYLYLAGTGDNGILDLGASSIEWIKTGGGNDTLNATTQTQAVTVYAGGGNDRVTGSAHNDTLYGEDGGDTLNGGGGADSLVGGLGDDAYVVDDGGDMVTENTGEGIDTVGTALSFHQLAANVENLTYTGSDFIVGFGNDANNVLNAASAANSVLLQGLGGADQMIGGSGNDVLYFDSLDTLVQGGAGVDTALVYVAETAGVSLDLAGTGLEVVFGGVGDDSIDATGVTEAVTLVGLGGADTLIGGSGNDVLYFDSLDTSLQGGAGVDSAAVFFTETGPVSLDLTATGIEVAYGSVSGDILTAAGKTENTHIEGLGGNDTLTGGSMDDAIFGGAGDDAIFASAGNDYLQGDAGTDSVTYAGNIADFTLTDIGGGFYFITGAGIGTQQLFQIEVLHFNNGDLVL